MHPPLTLLRSHEVISLDDKQKNTRHYTLDGYKIIP